MRIAVDAMGGDHAPDEIDRGVAALSLEAPHIQTLLVGDEPRLTELLTKIRHDAERISIHHAGEVVGMEDKPAETLALRPDASIIVAARLVAAGAGESIRTVPKGVPRAGGPTISQAVLESPASIMVTVTHDAGNDLRVPLLAKTGAGWAVVDGTAASVPRPVIGVSACVRVDATHLRLTLASAMSPDGMATPAQCSLYYPYGVTKIGRGNAITDNCTAVAKPPGWDIAADMGPAWAIDFPLQATMHGVPLSRRAKPL